MFLFSHQLHDCTCQDSGGDAADTPVEPPVEPPPELLEEGDIFVPVRSTVSTIRWGPFKLTPKFGTVCSYEAECYNPEHRTDGSRCRRTTRFTDNANSESRTRAYLKAWLLAGMHPDVLTREVHMDPRKFPHLTSGVEVHPEGLIDEQEPPAEFFV